MSNSTKFPGTVTDISGYVAWVNPNNIKATDSTYATCPCTSGSSSGDPLQGTNYGFAVSGTINGAVASLIGHVSNAGRIYDLVNQFLKGGSLSGTNYALSAGGGGPTTGAWATSDSTLTYGTSTTLSGMSLAASDVNGSGFGFEYQPSTSSSNMTSSIDSMPIEVYYTAGASPTTYPAAAIPVPFVLLAGLWIPYTLAIARELAGQICLFKQTRFPGRVISVPAPRRLILPKRFQIERPRKVVVC
jgi:hypothetical protein